MGFVDIQERHWHYIPNQQNEVENMICVAVWNGRSNDQKTPKNTATRQANTLVPLPKHIIGHPLEAELGEPPAHQAIDL